MKHARKVCLLCLAALVALFTVAALSGCAGLSLSYSTAFGGHKVAVDYTSGKGVAVTASPK